MLPHLRSVRGSLEPRLTWPRCLALSYSGAMGWSGVRQVSSHGAQGNAELASHTGETHNTQTVWRLRAGAASELAARGRGRARLWVREGVSRGRGSGSRGGQQQSETLAPARRAACHPRGLWEGAGKQDPRAPSLCPGHSSSPGPHELCGGADSHLSPPRGPRASTRGVAVTPQPSEGSYTVWPPGSDSSHSARGPKADATDSELLQPEIQTNAFSRIRLHRAKEITPA